jgi:hypothetical protein
MAEQDVMGVTQPMAPPWGFAHRRCGRIVLRLFFQANATTL